MAKWIWGLILIAIAALLLTLFGPWNAKQRSADMGASIERALKAEGIQAKVDMHGDVAKLSGEMPSAAVRDKALSIAKGTACETCGDGQSSLLKGKQANWHEVSDGLTVKPAPKLPAAKPYTFEAAKSADGGVVVNGFVPSKEAMTRVLNDANSKFDTVINNRLKLASGVPNANWGDVITAKLTDLDQLDSGRLSIIDTRVRLTGVTRDAAIRDAVSASALQVPDEYTAEESITLQTLATCQTQFDALKRGNKVNFASGKSELVGEGTYNLLNSLAAAAKECASYNIRIVGHTDSEGRASYNQWLSESRANSVVNYLVSQGIGAARLAAQGLGETNPIASNNTVAGKAQNRRIEFIVTQ